MEDRTLIRILQGENLKGKWKLALQMDMIHCGSCEKSYLDCRSLGIVWQVKSIEEGLRKAADVFAQFDKMVEEGCVSEMDPGKKQTLPNVKDIGEALKLIAQAAREAGLSLGKDAWLIIDAGADALHQADSGLYFFPGETRAKCEALGGQKEKVTAHQPDTIGTHINRSTTEIVEFYRKLVEEYPVCCIRNALYGKDMEGWEKLADTLGRQWERKENDFFRK